MIKIELLSDHSFEPIDYDNVWYIPISKFENFVLLENINPDLSVTKHFFLYDIINKKIILSLVLCDFFIKKSNFKAYSVHMVSNNIDYRGKGITKKVYVELLKLGYTLVSGESQSKYSRYLWISLAKDFNVMLCDFKRKDFVIKENYIPYGINDENVWNDESLVRLMIKGER